MSEYPARFYRTVLIAVLALVILATLISRFAIGLVIHDQAELVVFSQTLRWTYDEQMPVLAWLTTLLLNLTHYFILVPDILKYAGVAAAVLSVWHLTVRSTGSARAGLIAALGLFLVPTMNEDMLREYTHTAALIGFSAGSFAVLLSNPRENGLPRSLLLLAIIWAGGILSKYTMLLIMAGQAGAFFLLYRPSWQTALKLAATAALALLLASPVFVLMTTHAGPVEAGVEEFLATDPLQRVAGLVDLVTSMLAEGLLIWVFLWIACYRSSGAAPTSRLAPSVIRTEHFLLLSVAITIAILAIIILAANVSVVRDRWLAPVLMMLTPVIASRMERNWNDLANTIIAGFLVIWLGAFGLVRATEPLIDGWTGEFSVENYPLRSIARETYQMLGDGEPVLTNSEHFGGTLKVMYPAVRIYTGETFHLAPETDSVLVVSTHTRADEVLALDPAVWTCGREEEFSAPLRFMRNARFPYSFQSCRRIRPAG